VTESFLSKEISCVVSSSKEAKRDNARTRTEKWSSRTSEKAKAASPTPSASKGNRPRPHQKPPDTALISRGKELLQKAMKNQVSSVWTGFAVADSILANARLWGVQILHVDGILLCRLKFSCCDYSSACAGSHAKYVPLSSRQNASRPDPKFPKVSLQVVRFRPFHHQFKSFPDLNLLAPKGSSPFEPPKSLSNSGRASEGEKSPWSTPVTVPKKKRGFCECCQETFEELQEHLQSPQHRRFALDDSQYAPVDRVILQLTSSF
ncbi:DBF4B protein, partial [Pterocles burchelli]|nr:DBF4B protein [Pterocles burchelli]